MNETGQFWVYVLENPVGRFYVGQSSNLERRLVQHNEPLPRDGKYTLKNGPWKRSQDVIDLQLLTGARPGELLMLTGEIIDQSQDIWISKLADHKTSQQGKAVCWFSVKAQAILRRYFVDDPTQELFTFTRKGSVWRSAEHIEDQ